MQRTISLPATHRETTHDTTRPGNATRPDRAQTRVGVQYQLTSTRLNRIPGEVIRPENHRNYENKPYTSNPRLTERHPCSGFKYVQARADTRCSLPVIHNPTSHSKRQPNLHSRLNHEHHRTAVERKRNQSVELLYLSPRNVRPQ